MSTVAEEYEGKHRLEANHDCTDGEACAAFETARAQLESAMRGVRNESPRHAAPRFYATPNPYEPCVINSQGQCTRWSHDHRGEASS